MAASHGTASRYAAGCRWDSCTKAHRLAARDYRRRKATLPPQSDAGPVELAFKAEVAGLTSAGSQPVLVAMAIAMAQNLDAPHAGHSKTAAGRLADILDKLHSSSAPRPRGKLALVKAMTTGGATPPA
jgi:hypothetical protein